MTKLLILSVLMLNRFIVAPAVDSPIVVKDPNSNRYLVTVSANDVPAKISFGDRNKFIPKMRSSKWKDEAWLTIEHPDKLSITNQKPSLTDGKLQIGVGDRTHRYYIDEQGNIEYEIEFATKPDSNVVTLDINFPDGLKFYYQDTLENEYAQDNFGYDTLEEYLENHERPDNVVGSYAVYWNKRNNEYKTGKYCHFFRPETIDADGKRAWCNLHIDPKAKKLLIGFNDSAKYPLILDPTIGYTTEPQTNVTTADAIFVTRFACGTNGTTASATMNVWIGSAITESEGRGCVYTDNSGTVASQAKLSSNEAELVIDATNTWEQATITPPAFASGTDYWVGAHIHNCKLEYDEATAGYDDTEYKGSITYTPAQNDLPANFDATPSTAAREYGFFITYTEDAGGATGQVIMISN